MKLTKLIQKIPSILLHRFLILIGIRKKITASEMAERFNKNCNEYKGKYRMTGEDLSNHKEISKYIEKAQLEFIKERYCKKYNYTKEELDILLKHK